MTDKTRQLLAKIEFMALILDEWLHRPDADLDYVLDLKKRLSYQRKLLGHRKTI